MGVSMHISENLIIKGGVSGLDVLPTFLLHHSR